MRCICQKDTCYHEQRTDEIKMKATRKKAKGTIRVMAWNCQTIRRLTKTKDIMQGKEWNM